MVVYVGMSGWNYREWRDTFYAKGLPTPDWLSYYVRHFPTVELNASFYGLPTTKSFARWKAVLPPGFVMAVKANRELTHVARLQDPAPAINALLEHARPLGDSLGPILLQLPPSLRADADLLDACLDAFPADVRVAVEPRHESWWTEKVANILAKHDSALAWADRGGRPVTPLWNTASWGYLRLHEGDGTPWPAYAKGTLRQWAERVVKTFPDDVDVFTYFNNDPGTAPLSDGPRFAGLVTEIGGRVVPVGGSA